VVTEGFTKINPTEPTLPIPGSMRTEALKSETSHRRNVPNFEEVRGESALNDTISGSLKFGVPVPVQFWVVEQG